MLPRSFIALFVALAVVAAAPATSHAGRVKANVSKSAPKGNQAKAKNAKRQAPPRAKKTSDSGAEVRSKVGRLGKLRSGKPFFLAKRAPVRDRQKEVAGYLATGQHTKAARAVVRSLTQGRDGRFQKGGFKNTMTTVRESFSMWRATRKVYRDARKLAVKRGKLGDRQGVDDSAEALSTLNAAGRLGLVSRFRANRALKKADKALVNAPRKQMIKSIKASDGQTAMASVAEARQQPAGFWNRQLARVKMDKQNRAERKAVRIAKRRAKRALRQGDIETATALGEFIYGVRGDTARGRAKLRAISRSAKKLAKSFAEQGQTEMTEQAIELAAAFSAAGTKPVLDRQGNPVLDANGIPQLAKAPKFTVDGKAADKIRARSGNLEWRQHIKAAKSAPPDVAAAHLARARQIESNLGKSFSPGRFNGLKRTQGRLERTLGNKVLDAKAELAKRSAAGEQGFAPEVAAYMSRAERNERLANGEEL